MSTRSARANRTAMRSATANASRCESVKTRLPMRAYFASRMCPSKPGKCSFQRFITSMSQSDRAFRNSSRKTRAPALDSESARGEQVRWNSFGMAPWPSTERLDHCIGIGDHRDVLEREVDRRVVPIRVHCRAAILRHDHEKALVGPGACGVFNRHIGPGAGIDDHVAAGRFQDGFESRALPRAHAHLLDDEIAGSRLKS